MPVVAHRRPTYSGRAAGRRVAAVAMPVVKVVWLDNPPVNAINRAMLETIERAIDEPGESTRVLVLRGRGERAFSVGADVTDFAERRPGLAAAIQRTASRDRDRAGAGARRDPGLSASAAGSSWRSPATCASRPRTRSSASRRSGSA